MASVATGMKDTRLVDRYLTALIAPLKWGDPLPGGWSMSVADRRGRLCLLFEKAGSMSTRLYMTVRDDGKPCYARTKNLNLFMDTQPEPSLDNLLKRLLPLFQKNDLRVREDQAQQLLSRVQDAGVRSVDFSIQPVCNNNCVFCSNQPSTIGKFTTEDVLARIESEFEQGANWLEFSAMEPTLRKDLPQLIQKGVELGFDGIHVISNGQNFSNRKLTERLIGAGVTKITVSIHSPYNETEAAITRHPDSLPKKKEGIKNILEVFGETFPHCKNSFELPLYTNTIINGHNYQHLPETVEMLMDLGVGRIHLFYPRILGNAYRDFEEVIPRMSAVAPFVNEAVRRGKARGALMAVCDLPQCVLDDRQESMNYRLKKEVLLAQKDKSTLYEFLQDVEKEKTKREECESCKSSPFCEGVFTEYVKRRGWDEFQPLQ